MSPRRGRDDHQVDGFGPCPICGESPGDAFTLIVVSRPHDMQWTLFETCTPDSNFVSFGRLTPQEALTGPRDGLIRAVICPLGHIVLVSTGENRALDVSHSGHTRWTRTLGRFFGASDEASGEDDVAVGGRRKYLVARMYGSVGGGKSEIARVLKDGTQITYKEKGSAPFTLHKQTHLNVEEEPLHAAYAEIPATRGVERSCKEALTGYLRRMLPTENSLVEHSEAGADTVVNCLNEFLSRTEALGIKPDENELQFKDRIAKFGASAVPITVAFRLDFDERNGSKQLSVLLSDLSGEDVPVAAGRRIGQGDDYGQFHVNHTRLGAAIGVIDVGFLESVYGKLDETQREACFRVHRDPTRTAEEKQENCRKAARDANAAAEVVLDQILSEARFAPGRDINSSVRLVVVLSKCDIIRSLLKQAARADVAEMPDVGKEDCVLSPIWGANRPGLKLAARALNSYAGYAASEDDLNYGASEVASALLTAFQQSDEDQQLDIVQQILCQCADPERFWALVHGDDVLCRESRIVTVSLPNNKVLELKPEPSRSYLEARVRKGIDITVRDLLTAVVSCAILAPKLSETSLDAMTAHGPVYFVLTSARDMVDVGREKATFPPKDSAGHIQLLTLLMQSLMRFELDSVIAPKQDQR